MKKLLYVAFIAIVGICLVSCEKGQKEFYLSDLQGEWIEDGTTHHVRFTTEAADEPNYFWGCEWGVDDIEEEDLVYHGNGWFKYNLNEKNLLEVHMMDYGWADIPKQYIMVTLTGSKMTFYPKDFKNEKKNFTKQ
jgi:hypothetical protein